MEDVRAHVPDIINEPDDGICEIIKVKGFYRIQVLNPDGTVASERSGHNTICNRGFSDYIGKSLGSITGSSYVGYIALGTGTAPAAADTSLQGEITAGNTFRQSVTASQTSASSKDVYFTAGFASGWNTATVTLQNIGLYRSSSGGTLFSGASYTTQQCSTNQAVNCTYSISFN